MNKNNLRLQLARMRAGEILLAEGINDFPINPKEIANRHGIVVEAKPETVEGVSGMLLRHGDSFGILYATHISSDGFQNFSIAHELGHYFLNGHIDHIFRGNQGTHSSRAGFASGDIYELEADHFAASLLMPQKLFKNALTKYVPGLAAIEALATQCSTSLTATAIRYAELTDDAIAVIVSSGQKVDYCFLSDSMKQLKEISWPTKGSSVPRETLTSTYNQYPQKFRGKEKISAEIDIQDWFGGKRSLVACEEVIGLGAYQKTLTILSSSIDEDQAYLDKYENDDMEESWTPRFRR